MDNCFLSHQITCQRPRKHTQKKHKKTFSRLRSASTEHNRLESPCESEGTHSGISPKSELRDEK